MSTVTVRSYRREREREVMGNLDKSMGIVGAIVERQAKINVSKTGSEHPQVQTGRLRASIMHRVSTSGAAITTEIGTNVDYGKDLEFGTSRHPPYPWLFPSVEEKKSDIIEALKGHKITIL